MRSLSELFCVFTVLLLICCEVLVVSAAAQEIRFRFNPPHDFPGYISTYKNTRTTNMGALGKQTRVSEAKGKVTIHKTPQGYSVIADPISFTMTQDGQQVDDPITSSLQNTKLTYILDAEGQFLELRGFEGFLDRLKALLPNELPPTIASLLNEETIIKKTAQIWDARIGTFVGSDVQIGDVWVGVSEEPLPIGGGTMTFYSVTKFAEQLRYNDVDCVRLEFSFNSDAEELREFMGDTWGELAELTETEGPLNVSDSEVAGKGERIIDPTTMLIYSETVERTIKTTMAIPGGQAVEMVMVEKREYGYEEIAR